MLDPFPSPLRYPGGKGKLSNYVRLILQENDLIGHHYLEPYAGGAAVALGLLYDHHVSSIHINDADPAIFSFWHSVINHTDDLCKLIADTPVNIATWQHQKDVLASFDPDPLDLGFATFFLNRTNRSGILRAGLIGGKAQTGTWKMDARYVQAPLVARIRKVAHWKSRIALSQYDASEVMRNVVPSMPRKTFIYLDPPYVAKGSDLYRNFYTEEGHREIGTLVSAERRPWIVSYDDTPLVYQIYSGFDFERYLLSYSAQDRRQGGEVMFYSKDLQPPSVAQPSRVKRTHVDSARFRRLHIPA